MYREGSTAGVTWPGFKDRKSPWDSTDGGWGGRGSTAGRMVLGSEVWGGLEMLEHE